jgi:y4mF family transcriptional regulator
MFIRRPNDIGALVRATRQARGLNQQELADKLGVSRWWVNEFERGKPTARLDIVLRALAELEITLSAHVQGQTRQAIEPASSRIDIDAIADTGLAPAKTPQVSKRQRP